MKKIFLLIALLALAVTGCTPSVGNTNLPPMETVKGWDDVVLSSLDGTEVILSDYLYWYRLNQGDMENAAIGSGLNTEEDVYAIWNEPGSEDLLAELRDVSLTDAKQYATLLRVANEAGAVLDPAAKAENELLVDDVAATFGQDAASIEKGFYEFFGITIEQMKHAYQTSALINQYLSGLMDNMPVSDAELTALYEANPDEFESVVVRHILISADDSMTDEEKKTAEELARELLSMIENGSDIGELAKEYSEDPGSKDSNGEYVIARGDTVAEFDEWSFSAQPGDRGIVLTDYGYHVMELVRKAGMNDLRDMLRSVYVNDHITMIIDDAGARAALDWVTDESLLEQIKPFEKVIAEQPDA